MKENSKVGVHRDINSSVIKFEKEVLMNVFYGIVKLFNNELEKDIIEVSKFKLWKLMGFKNENYNPEHARHIIKKLTKSNTYEISENNKISGSIFVIKEEQNSIFIEIPQTFRPYIFNKKDVGILAKVKKNEQLNVKELDYWDNVLKIKKKSLVLLKEADIYNINGKYAKRLYTILAQWRKMRRFNIKIDKFRKMMEIPESYRMSNIDVRVIKPAVKEICEKTDLKDIEIKKIKKGKKIDKIEFRFRVSNSNNKENLKQMKISENQTQINNEISEKLLLFKDKIIEQIKDDYALRAELAPLTSQDDIKDFIIKHNIKL